MRRPLLLPVLLLAPVPFSRASGDHDAAIAQFRSFAQDRMRADGAPGLSIGFRKGDLVWAEGFGFADLENEGPASAHSSYRLASVTKPMTAVAVLALVEKGKLDLDAEVQTYVPDFPRKPHPVTVRQLLGHLGGISHYRDPERELHFKERKGTRESIAVFADFDLVAEPGTRYVYSSYGYNLLGAVIEGASGKPYGEFLRETLWGPLGMEATRMDDAFEIIQRRVRGYRRGPDGRIANSEFVDISSRFAAGGTRSTVLDLLKLADALRPGKILSEGTIEAMLASMATREGRRTDYGMGIGVGSVNGRFLVAHGGSQPETRTYWMCLPEDDLVFAAACNFEGGDPQPYVRRLYSLVTGEPWPPAVYTGDRAADAIVEAITSVFEDGASRWQRARGGKGPSAEEVAASFAYFNDNADPGALASDFETSRRNLSRGRHPVAGEPFSALGAFVASRIVETRGEARLDAVRRRGPFAFFVEYLELCDRDASVPETLRFRKSVGDLARRWHADWERAWDEFTQSLVVTASADLDATAKGLRERFEGASVYPDFGQAFAEAARECFVAGDPGKALRVAELAVALYPKADARHVGLGVARLASGKVEKAEASFRRALELDPRGDARADSLLRYARNLRSLGHRDLGIALLEVATRLHPDAASLLEALGGALREKGDLEAAAAAYRRALEIDPGLERARAALSEIPSKP